jgi:hypothetical protein
LMFANAPPLGLFQVQTLGGVYSAASFMRWLQGMARYGRVTHSAPTAE